MVANRVLAWATICQKCPTDQPNIRAMATEAARLRNARYKRTAKGRAANLRYNCSAKGKAAKARYKRSAKGKIANKRYETSAKGRAIRAGVRERYRAKRKGGSV